MILYLHDIIHDYNVKLCLHEKSPDPCESGDVWDRLGMMVLLDG